MSVTSNAVVDLPDPTAQRGDHVVELAFDAAHDTRDNPLGVQLAVFNRALNSVEALIQLRESRGHESGDAFLELHAARVFARQLELAILRPVLALVRSDAQRHSSLCSGWLWSTLRSL